MKMYFTPNGGSIHTLFDNGATVTARWLDRWNGWGKPPVRHFIEEIPSQYGNLDRTAIYDTREVEVIMDHIASSEGALWASRREWDGWHDSILGEGVLKVITDDTSPKTRCLDCRPLRGEWEVRREDEILVVHRVTQLYSAAVPFWRDESESSDSDTISSVPATVTVVNAGDVACPVRVVITGGLVNTPVITLDASNVMQINAALAHAGDVLQLNTDIDAIPVTYTPNGGAADYTWYNYRSTATTFFLVPAGSHNLTISCTSGSGTLTVYWKNRYLSI